MISIAIMYHMFGRGYRYFDVQLTNPKNKYQKNKFLYHAQSAFLYNSLKSDVYFPEQNFSLTYQTRRLT